MTPKDFVKLLRPYAKAVQDRFFIPWEVMVAQAALETGWLAHPTKDKRTGRDSYNLFNIKARAGQDHVVIDTHEYINGKKVLVEAKFRAYKSYAESFSDYAQLIAKSPRYAKAMLQVHDPVKFAYALQECGYATDPLYGKKIEAIIGMIRKVD